MTQLISLARALQLHREETLTVLQAYRCPINLDIQRFLQDKACEYDRRNWSKTHLVFSKGRDGNVLAGYYTLAMKALVVHPHDASRTFLKTARELGEEDVDGTIHVPALLIAQLGRNYAPEADGLLDGSTLIRLAMNRIKRVQESVGGKLVYVECENEPKLCAFYESQKFRRLATPSHSGLLRYATYVS